MGVANDLMETAFKHREWRVIPDETHPNCFKLQEIKTGKVLGSFVLAEGSDPELLNLIACAPELQDIAEMYRDHMIGKNAQNTMVFSMVIQTLERAAQPYETEVLECV